MTLGVEAALARVDTLHARHSGLIHTGLQGVKADPGSLRANPALNRPHSPTKREALTSECISFLSVLLLPWINLCQLRLCKAFLA